MAGSSEPDETGATQPAVVPTPVCTLLRRLSLVLTMVATLGLVAAVTYALGVGGSGSWADKLLLVALVAGVGPIGGGVPLISAVAAIVILTVLPNEPEHRRPELLVGALVILDGLSMLLLCIFAAVDALVRRFSSNGPTAPFVHPGLQRASYVLGALATTGLSLAAAWLAIRLLRRSSEPRTPVPPVPWRTSDWPDPWADPDYAPADLEP
jgi:hypothetical protein